MNKIWGIRLLVSLGVAMAMGTSSRLFASSGTEGASFLDIPVGARPAALGSAYSASATDAYAPVWNPAGLGFLNGTQLAAQHLSYLESIHHEYLGFVHPLSDGKALGLSVQYLGTGDITETDTAGNSIGNYSSHYAAYSLAYGQNVSKKLSVGVTGKWINAKLADVSGNAYAADLGSMFKATDKLTLAATLTNLGNRLKFYQDGDNLPMAFHAAAAWQAQKQLKLTAEGVYSRTGVLNGRLGTEWMPIQLIALRAGYKTDTTKGLSALAGLTVGMGLKVWGQELSYAWLPYGDLGNTQYLSLVLRMGGDKDEQRNLVQFQEIKKHRSASKKADPSEPEYDQLMQLLSEQDAHVAQAPEDKKH